MSEAFPLIEGRELGLHKRGVELLQGNSLSLREGERVALVGESGAGKSLLLRTLALLEPGTSGTLLYRGKPVAEEATPAYRGRVIYLHQRPSFFDGTVENNLTSVLSLGSHLGKHFEREAAIRHLSAIGWKEEFLTKVARDLSGGEAQVAALLRAIQLDPEVLLLDEPTAALDPQKIAVLESLVSHWHAEGGKRKAYLWVTHQLEQAARVSDRVLRMAKGKCQPE